MLPPKQQRAATSTVGRGKSIVLASPPKAASFAAEGVSLHLGDSLSFYGSWERPTTIVSDGAYGVLGFEGDTSRTIRRFPVVTEVCVQYVFEARVRGLPLKQ